MTVCHLRGDAAALGPDQETFLDQERFIYFFQGARVFADRRCERAHADRTALERRNQRAEDLVVDRVETPFVNLELIEGETRDFEVDVPVPDNLGKVPDPFQESVGYSRRAPAPECDLDRSVIVNLHIEDRSAANNDSFQILFIVIL